MKDTFQLPAVPLLSPDSPPLPPLMALDTTAGSVLHQLFGYPLRLGLELANPVIYIAAVALTFLPLLVGAILSPLSLTVSTETLKLPFLSDWNVLFMFLVSFPCLIILTVTDQHVLSSSLKSVQLDGTVTISEAEATPLSVRWHRLFRITNFTGQLVGVVVGMLVAYFNYVVYTPASVGFWIVNNGRLLPVGFVYLYCIFLFYALGTVYVFRSVAISLLFRDIVKHAQLHLLPLHPDKSGGLRPVGRLGLRNQYVLTIFGLNIVLLIMTSLLHLQVPSSLYVLITIAVIAYLILSPLVFLAPLLPFRAGMLRTKGELMAGVAQRLRLELQRLRAQMQSGPISKEDEELIDRLCKIGAVIDELPVWPFDAGTLRKFLAAYAIPVLGSVGYPIVKVIFDFASHHLH